MKLDKALRSLVLSVCERSGKVSLDIKLNGVPISAPLSVEKLGSDYSVGNNGSSIMYKGETIADVTFDNGSTESDQSKKKITGLVSITDGSTKSVSVNGIVTGSAKSEVLKALGEPLVKDETSGMWMYRANGKSGNDNNLLISFDIYGKVSQIKVRL